MDDEINFEEFNIPDWAARLIGTDEDGYLIEYAQLMSRDGRRTGNAVIRKVEPLTEWVITVVTDMGNELVLTRGEAEELFFEPVYIMKADAVGVRLGRNATPDEPKTECTNSDTWNCKYCRKTQTCDALNNDRNFGGTVKPEPEDKTDTVAASNGLKVNIEVLCDKLATARVALADAEANMKLLRDLLADDKPTDLN